MQCCAVIFVCLLPLIALGSVNDAAEKTVPPNEWGPYYEIGVDAYRTMFNFAFQKHVASSDSPKSGCDSVDQTDLNRFYKSNKDDSMLFSYYCTSSDKDSRGYELLQVDPSSSQPKKFGAKMSDFGIIGDGYYPRASNAETVDAAKAEIDRLFDGIESQLQVMTECPGNYSTETYPKLLRKDENELKYFKFNIACKDETGKPLLLVQVEVAEDQQYKYYNDGAAILVGQGRLNNNKKWVEENWSGKQIHVYYSSALMDRLQLFSSILTIGLVKMLA